MFCLICLQTGWTIVVDVVIGPQDGICYRAERGSLVSSVLPCNSQVFP